MGSVIERWELFPVAPRWLFLRVETSDGVVGWGEPIVEGMTAETQSVVDAMMSKLVGWETSRIEDAWQFLFRGGFYRGGPLLTSALAGIDQALWDIRGKQLGVPIYDLFGGAVRDKVRVYGWVGGDTPDDLERGLEDAVSSGMTAVKMNGAGKMRFIESPGKFDALVHNARLARDVLGPHRDFAMDFHGRFSTASARVAIRALEEFNPMFVEEPLVPELAASSLGKIIDGTTIPIALGERVYSRWEFLPLLQQGLAVVQPDPSHASGISELRRIATLADSFGAAIAPHCPLGPIALAASLQVDFNASNFLIQEQSLGIHYNESGGILDYLMDTSVFAIHDGYINRMVKPGLGIEIDEKAVRDAAKRGHDWKSPTWRHDDGSFAEW
jgi:galactonate dehydratase